MVTEIRGTSDKISNLDLGLQSMPSLASCCNPTCGHLNMALFWSKAWCFESG